MDAEGMIVEVAGRLDGDAVAELEAVTSARSGPLRLDLGGLRSADEAGVKALRALRARGASLIRVSPYHRLLLEGT
jgi:anti-anti-sigma regulatory factor